MASVFILSSANISTQWVGWFFSVIACIMWVYFGYKDKDGAVKINRETDLIENLDSLELPPYDLIKFENM